MADPLQDWWGQAMRWDDRGCGIVRVDRYADFVLVQEDGRCFALDLAAGGEELRGDWWGDGKGFCLRAGEVEVLGRC